MFRRSVASLLLCGAVAWAAQESPAITAAVRKNENANALLLAGKPQQAIPLYRELAAAFPQQLSFRTNLVLALYNAGHYAETVDQCRALLKKQPELFPALIYLGASQVKLGAALAAEEPLRKALLLNANDLNARIMLADALLLTARPSEAAEQYEIVRQALPQNPRVLFGLARAYDAAVEASLQQMEHLSAAAPEALALRAELDLDKDQFAPAFTGFKHALALQPGLPGIHELIAQVYERTGHTEWAAIERAKTPADAATASAFYTQAKTFRARAQEAYEQLKSQPASSEAHQALALEHEKHSRYPDAAASWKEALAIEPGEAQIELRLATALCHANDYAAALPLLKKQLARTPDSPELNYLLGLAFINSQAPAEAIPYLESCVKRDPKRLLAQASLGAAYLEINKPAYAIEHLKLAVAGDDPDGSLHYQLARAYRSAGMQTQAAATLQDYREILQRRAKESAALSAITAP